MSVLYIKDELTPIFFRFFPFKDELTPIFPDFFQLAVAAAALWEISPKETAYLTKAYEEILSFRKKRGEDEKEDD